jgi:hypothetical protein
MRGWIPWALILISGVAHAEKTYPQRVAAVRESQVDVDQALLKLGRSVGFDPNSSGNDQREEKPKALFQIHTALATTQLPQGKLLFGRLVNRLVVGSDGSPVLIEFDPEQGFLSGLRAMGLARQAGADGRVSIDLTRLLTRTSSAVTIHGTGLDSDGAFGLPAQVFSGKALAVGGAMASSFIAGLASAQQSQATTALGFSQVQPTGRNAILQGVAQTAADQSKRLIEESTAEKPVLVVDALTPVTVLVQEEAKW